MKAVFLNITKNFMLVFMLCTLQVWQVVNANPVEELPWIIDEHQLISIKVAAGITPILAESASNRDIHVRVLVLNRQDENLKEIFDQEVMALKNKMPAALQEKTTFFIINIGTRSSTILLGNALVKTEPLYQSLVRIQQKIVLPLLADGQLDNALTQGVVAITTVLEGEEAKKNPTFLQKIYLWLSGNS